MHNLQTHLNAGSVITPKCFGMSVPSLGNSYANFKTCWYLADYIHSSQ